MRVTGFCNNHHAISHVQKVTKEGVGGGTGKIVAAKLCLSHVSYRKLRPDAAVSMTTKVRIVQMTKTVNLVEDRSKWQMVCILAKQ